MNNEFKIIILGALWGILVGGVISMSITAMFELTTREACVLGLVMGTACAQIGMILAAFAYKDPP